MIIDLSWRSDLFHLALAHDNDLIGDTHGLRLIVGHIDSRDADFLLDLSDLRPHGNAELRVQIA